MVCLHVVEAGPARHRPRVLEDHLALTYRATSRGDSGVEPLATRVVIADASVAIGVPDDLLQAEVGELVLDAYPSVPIGQTQPTLDRVPK